MSPFLTVEELAERWHTTPKAVHNMKHKLPPVVKIGRRLLWDMSDIEAYEAGRREEPAKKERPRFSKPAAWPAKKDYSTWGKTG